MKSIVFLIAALAVSCASLTEAAVVDANNDPRALGKRAILDESEQLLWMDLNHTLGLSYGSALWKGPSTQGKPVRP